MNRGLMCEGPGPCVWEAKARGLCSAHLSQLRRTGTLKPIVGGKQPSKCLVYSCEWQALVKGYCKRHYENICKGLEIEKVGCRVPDCWEPYLWGWCEKHQPSEWDKREAYNSKRRKPFVPKPAKAKKEKPVKVIREKDVVQKPKKVKNDNLPPGWFKTTVKKPRPKFVQEGVEAYPESFKGPEVLSPDIIESARRFVGKQPDSEMLLEALGIS